MTQFIFSLISQKFKFEEYGVNLINQDGRLTVDTLKWNGLAKRSGFETDDVIDFSSYTKGIEILKKYKIEI